METTQTLSSEQYPTNEKKGIPGSTIKIIAIVAMLIDHTGAVILERLLLYRGYGFATINSDALHRWMARGTNGILLVVYYAMRLIGRFGFPIFCFLLVEGFIHTHSRIKYALRLFLFCLISEIPFDLALTGRWFYPSYQNVFFTLWIGFLAMCAFDYIQKHTLKKWLHSILGILGVIVSSLYLPLFFSNLGLDSVLISLSDIFYDHYYRLAALWLTAAVILCLFLVFYSRRYGLEQTGKLSIHLGILFISMFCADLLQTDYSGMGVLTIAVMYAFRDNRIRSMFAGCVVLTLMSLMEATAFLMLIPISRYNGQRGLRIKYFFYIFYPAHLAILFLICKLMGIA